MQWTTRYLPDVEKWLDSLDEVKLEAIAKDIKKLEALGNTARMPLSRALKDGIYELREQEFGLRLYYCFCKGRIIILLCAGDKKSQEKDIRTAKKLSKQFKKGDFL